MAAANIDMASRDYCAHILIKLNECRSVALPAVAHLAALLLAGGGQACCTALVPLQGCRACNGISGVALPLQLCYRLRPALNVLLGSYP
jgi:hypothetical protein